MVVGRDEICHTRKYYEERQRRKHEREIKHRNRKDMFTLLGTIYGFCYLVLLIWALQPAT